MSRYYPLPTGGRVTDRMTHEDRVIYARMPMVGRLMVHRDREDAEVMRDALDIGRLSPVRHVLLAGYGLNIGEYKKAFNL